MWYLQEKSLKHVESFLICLHANNPLYFGERCLRQIGEITVIPVNPPDVLVNITTQYLYNDPNRNFLHFSEVTAFEYMECWSRRFVRKYSKIVEHEGNRYMYSSQDPNAYIHLPPPIRESTYTNKLLLIDHCFFSSVLDPTIRFTNESGRPVKRHIGNEYLSAVHRPSCIGN